MTGERGRTLLKNRKNFKKKEEEEKALA